MDKGFNIYSSEWLHGFGRFIVLTTSQHVPNGKDITSEAYIFALDSPPATKRFNKREIYYEYNSAAGDMNADLSFMVEEAQQQARNMIYEYQYAEYEKNKDLALMNSSNKLIECQPNILLTLKTHGNYEEELKSIQAETKSDGLRKYISYILSFQIKIKRLK